MNLLLFSFFIFTFIFDDLLTLSDLGTRLCFLGSFVSLRSRSRTLYGNHWVNGNVYRITWLECLLYAFCCHLLLGKPPRQPSPRQPINFVGSRMMKTREKRGLAFCFGAGFGLGSAFFSFFSEAGFLAGAFFLGFFSSSSSAASSSSEAKGTSSSSLVKSSPDSPSDS